MARHLQLQRWRPHPYGAKFQRLYRTNFLGRLCDHRQPKTLAAHVVHTLAVAISWGRRMVRVRSCCLHMFPSIRDEIKISSLPADCLDKFSAPDRGSFGVSNSCALWRFGWRREPSQLMCFLIPCIASNFHAMSFFLFRIYSESIPNPMIRNLFRNFKNVRKHGISCDSLIFGKKKSSFIFMVASMNRKISCVFSRFWSFGIGFWIGFGIDLEWIQYAFNLHVRLRWFNCCCQCRPFFVLKALGLCGSSPSM